MFCSEKHTCCCACAKLRWPALVKRHSSVGHTELQHSVASQEGMWSLVGAQHLFISGGLAMPRTAQCHSGVSLTLSDTAITIPFVELRLQRWGPCSSSCGAGQQSRSSDPSVATRRSVGECQQPACLQSEGRHIVTLRSLDGLGAAPVPSGGQHNACDASRVI